MLIRCVDSIISVLQLGNWDVLFRVQKYPLNSSAQSEKPKVYLVI